jgi:hypothetical protein
MDDFIMMPIRGRLSERQMDLYGEGLARSFHSTHGGGVVSQEGKQLTSRRYEQRNIY